MTEIEVKNPVAGVKYYDNLEPWMRKKYFEVINETCQLCHKKMLYKDMEVHRLKRQGYYTLCKLNHKKQNCMFVHSACHRLLHSNEEGCGSHSY